MGLLIKDKGKFSLRHRKGRMPLHLWTDHTIKADIATSRCRANFSPLYIGAAYERWGTAPGDQNDHQSFIIYHSLISRHNLRTTHTNGDILRKLDH